MSGGGIRGIRGINEFKKTFNSFGFGNISDDAFLTAVEIDLSRTGANITEIGIGHLARSVHDTSHYTNLETFHVLSGFLYAGYCGAEVVEGATASGTGDIFRFDHS